MMYLQSEGALLRTKEFGMSPFEIYLEGGTWSVYDRDDNLFVSSVEISKREADRLAKTIDGHHKRSTNNHRPGGHPHDQKRHGRRKVDSLIVDKDPRSSFFGEKLSPEEEHLRESLQEEFDSKQDQFEDYQREGMMIKMLASMGLTSEKDKRRWFELKDEAEKIGNDLDDLQLQLGKFPPTNPRDFEPLRKGSWEIEYLDDKTLKEYVDATRRHALSIADSDPDTSEAMLKGLKEFKKLQAESPQKAVDDYLDAINSDKANELRKEVLQLIDSKIEPTIPSQAVQDYLDSASSSDVERHESELRAFINAHHDKKNWMTPGKKEVIMKDMEEAVGKMTPTMLHNLTKSLQEIHIQPNVTSVSESVRDYVKNVYNDSMPDGLIAGMFDGQRGAIFLNGDRDSTGEPGIYSHELTHAYDWAEGGGSKTMRYSNSDVWTHLWMYEIRGPQNRDNPNRLTKYASSQPVEGFAEFGRLIAADPEAAAEQFPLCWAYFKQQGLME